MAAPSVVAVTPYVKSTVGLSWAVFSGVNVATGSVILVSASTTTAVNLSTASSGWSKVGEVDDIAGSFQGTSALFKATGPNTAFTVTSDDANTRYSAILVRVTGGGGVEATAQTDTDNPPNLDLVVTREAVWLAALTSDEDVVASIAPSGYSGLVTQAGDANGPSTSLAYKTATASSDNPSNFTTSSSSRALAAWTIALYHRRRSGRAGMI